MVKLKEGIEKERLYNFGFKKCRGENIMIKEIGALTIYVDLETRKITGCGFYPVGDRIVLDNIKTMITKGLIETNVDYSKSYEYFKLTIK